MGPIEQEMVNGYSALTARLNGLRPLPRITILSRSQELQAKLDSLVNENTKLVNENNGLRLQLWLEKVKVKKLKNPSYKHPIHKIITMVCQQEGVSKVDLIGSRRTKSVILPRQIAAYLCATTTMKSLPEIGRMFGKRDHTTIMYSRNKIAATRLVDNLLDLKLRQYEEQLNGSLV